MPLQTKHLEHSDPLLPGAPEALRVHLSGVATPIARRSSERDWLTARDRVGIGASEVPVLFGIGHSSPAELLLAKLGIWKADLSGVERVALGRDLEPAVLNQWGKRVRGVLYHNETAFQSQRFPTLVATPDGFVCDDSGVHSVQLKCTAMDSRWVDGIPEAVRLQMIAEMMVCNIAEAIAVRFTNMTITDSPVIYDERIAGEIAERVERFLAIVRGDERLDDRWVTGLDGERSALGKLMMEYQSKGKTISLPGREVLDLTDEIEHMKSIIKKAEKRKTVAENKLMAMTGDAEKAVLADGSEVRFSQVTVAERIQPGYSFIRMYVKKNRSK